MIVSAPGKVMLLGDYGVLEGGRAIVAAVNRRAIGRVVPEGRSSPVVEAVLARARRTELQVEIDTSSFYDGELKLGLGSSSAVSVVTAALATGRGDQRTLSIAIEGHRDANEGRGSGVDVAASFHGGVIATRRQPADVVVLPARLPGLHLSVLFTERSASTKDLVAACTASRDWLRWANVLRELTERGIEAWIQKDSARFLPLVAEYALAMAALGESAGVSIMTEELDAIVRLASEAGGAAKPSGAGGGDIAVLWARDPEIAERVAEKTGLVRLDLEIDPHGLRLQSLRSA